MRYTGFPCQNVQFKTFMNVLTFLKCQLHDTNKHLGDNFFKHADVVPQLYIYTSVGQLVTRLISFYIRCAKVWNNLPCYIRDITKTISETLLKLWHRLSMLYIRSTKIYDPDSPRSFKSLCVKCHASRPLTNLSKRLLLDLHVNKVFSICERILHSILHLGEVACSIFYRS